MLVAIVGVSMPVFWLGQLLLYVFWFRLGIMPSSGLEIGASIWESILQGKFILPWITVAVGYAAFYARMVRGNMIETMSDDYIRTARAKGLSERRVIFKHGLRGALTPVVTMLGIDLATVIGGLFITETLFGLPGVGQLAVVSIGRNDFPMVMGVTVLGALFIAIANLCVDVAYAFLDPRVRYSSVLPPRRSDRLVPEGVRSHVEVVRQRLRYFRGRIHGAHGGTHVRQPAIPLLDADRERGMPHPERRVAALLVIGRRPSPVLGQEEGQLVARGSQILAAPDTGRAARDRPARRRRTGRPALRRTACPRPRRRA